MGPCVRRDDVLIDGAQQPTTVVPANAGIHSPRPFPSTSPPRQTSQVVQACLDDRGDRAGKAGAAHPRRFAGVTTGRRPCEVFIVTKATGRVPEREAAAYGSLRSQGRQKGLSRRRFRWL